MVIYKNVLVLGNTQVVTSNGAYYLQLIVKWFRDRVCVRVCVCTGTFTAAVGGGGGHTSEALESVLTVNLDDTCTRVLRTILTTFLSF